MKARRSHIFKKERHGHYVEPAWCSRRLFEVEDFEGMVYDPACGWGTVVKEAMLAGYKACGSDIVSRAVPRANSRPFALGPAVIRDFLKLTECNGPFSIVTNPPFDLVREFCEHALKIGASKVAAISLVRRLNAARWLQDLPLQRVWLLTPRPSMPPGSYLKKGKKAGGGSQDFCWLVFKQGYAGAPAMRWLHRDGGKHVSESCAEHDGADDRGDRRVNPPLPKHS